MSNASRQPFTSSAASHPVLVDQRTGRVLRAAIRAELAFLTRRPFMPLPVAVALGKIFQKVRLQRAWALREMERDADVQARVSADRAALEVEALAIAMRHDFDPNTLSHLRNRWAYGSLADTWLAAGMRAKYSRAIEIATARQVPALLAAE